MPNGRQNSWKQKISPLSNSREHLSDEVAAFAATLPYHLDDFQVSACQSLAAGRNVLVCAPTGAGKTVVADFAIYTALQSPTQKVFYTTPIKALSNQKYNDLATALGRENVGLLTGDTNINPEARVVVMTTEVLRNMIYEGAARLHNLASVILDEVHYLADRFRGAVWEEVIIQLPKTVAVVGLSATVSNADEFGAWLESVRGSTDIVLSSNRPVPLEQHVLCAGELVDMLDSSGKHLSKQLLRSVRPVSRSKRDHHRREQRISRPAMIRLLKRQNLLPAIAFIFSRNGCDSAVSQTALEDLDLTTFTEREQIRDIVERKCHDIDRQDKFALGYHAWLDALTCGVAAHHAGMLPVFKETVEELVLKRLVKVVFATETLALGVNMPARTVVIESLEKFNGQQRVPLTPGEYTQLTGRAGRRGVDSEGHAIVLWRQDTDVELVRNLAQSGAYPLNSSFQPTYNMAVNLVDKFGVIPAQGILEASFAQFQADRAVASLVAERESLATSLSGYMTKIECDRGDFEEYAQLRHEQQDLEKLQRQALHSGDFDKRESLFEDISRVREKLQAHPCHACPDREDHARWDQRRWKLQRKIRSLDHQINKRTTSIAVRFESVLDVLRARDYISGEGEQTRVTDLGIRLQRIYGERDLLLAESVRLGLWDGLDAPTLAAVVSSLVYSPRYDDEDAIIPRGGFVDSFNQTGELWEDLDILEHAHNLPGTNPPDPGMAQAIFRWVHGSNLDIVLRDIEVSPGDFVRIARQTGDILGQLAAMNVELSDTASGARDLLERGVMADSTGSSITDSDRTEVSS